MVNIIKANGDREPFSEEKLLQSIQRAKIPQDLQANVVSQVESTLYEGIPTSEIYNNITQALSKSKEPYAKSRYSLKEAVMQLGPTGYPFEDYFAQILESRGYQVKTRQIMKGKCVTHEIDVLARKNGKTSMVEAKFHNSNGTRTDVHVSMYTKSRFDDIRERYSLDEAMIVTNTKATTDAIAFAECVGMKIFSWSYPEGGSLRDAIEELRLFPVTSLMTLTQEQKVRLIANHVALCKSICADNSLLEVLSLPKHQYDKVLEELQYLCSGESTSEDIHTHTSPRTYVNEPVS
jgi:Holliday junction resolvase-like predicted endonuclease